jgi:hypothetical protein
MERVLNRFDLAEAYTDKNNYDRLFPGVAAPPVLLRRMNHRYYDGEYRALNKADAAKLLVKANGFFIVKPSIVSGGGLNVQKVYVDHGALWVNDQKAELGDLTLMYGGDYLIQTAFDQHPAIAEFHPHSVNTIRIYTFRLDHEIHVASAILRLGNGGRNVDNGGIPCGIQSSGFLNDQAVTKFYFKHDVHPYTKKPFKGFAVPGWDSAREFVKRLHLTLPYFDTVSWDIAIGRDGVPALIEFNLCYQDISFLQVNNGPLFGDRTEAVLDSVFLRQAVKENRDNKQADSIKSKQEKERLSVVP